MYCLLPAFAGGLISSELWHTPVDAPNPCAGGHSEAFSESWVALCASGLETGLQRLSRSGTRLLAGCGFGRNGPQRQVRIIAVT